MKKQLIIIETIIFILFITDSYAYELGDRPQKIKQGILPKFCLCVGHIRNPCTGNLEKVKTNYYEYYGAIYTHAHHFCWGIDKFHKALSTSDQRKRNHLLRSAISEFDYVLDKKNQDVKRAMIPAVFLEKAKALIMLGENIQAMKSYVHAIKFNKNFIPAYIHYANLLNQTGDKTNACSVIKQGISNNPKDSNLKQYRTKYCSN